MQKASTYSLKSFRSLLEHHIYGRSMRILFDFVLRKEIYACILKSKITSKKETLNYIHKFRQATQVPAKFTSLSDKNGVSI